MSDAPESLRQLVDRFDLTAFDAPRGSARLRLEVAGEGAWELWVDAGGARLGAANGGPRADALVSADRATWSRLAGELASGLEAWGSGRLVVRHDLHLGVGFLVATSGATGPGRARFRRVETPSGSWSLLSAGQGEPVLLLHGLGATKGSFLPTIAGLAPAFEVIAVDLPGFGDSFKPLAAPYHAPFFAAALVELMDRLGIERAHLAGNSMGGRIALEMGLRHPARVRRIGLLAPSLAWRRARPWAPFLRMLDPRLGFVQLAPRPVVEAIAHRLLPEAAPSWLRAGVDEFLRAYLTPRGRVALYAAARQIYLEEPHGAKGFWTRLATLAVPALFVWGVHDRLVPLGFAQHVRDTLPSAHHLELDCGHVPQIERPDETNAALREFFAS
jgi:pimeloyl-ACP methyl ester carboxylesterase